MLACVLRLSACSTSDTSVFAKRIRIGRFSADTAGERRVSGATPCATPGAAHSAHRPAIATIVFVIQVFVIQVFVIQVLVMQLCLPYTLPAIQILCPENNLTPTPLRKTCA